LDAARRQVGILLFSEDLDEVMDLSDRIAVMFRGKIIGEFESQDVDRERIGLLIAGMAA
jgi:simple sugar transport system ATP-binding protein